MIKRLNLFVSLFLLAAITLSLKSCNSDDSLSFPKIILQIPEKGFTVEIGNSLSITPAISTGEAASYSWTLDGVAISNENTLTFRPKKVGTYKCLLNIATASGSDQKSFNIQATTSHSPYVTTIHEYVYAPGQHASLVPASSKAENFIGKPWENEKIFTYLGGWGGFLVAGFDHSVPNWEGADIVVFTQPSFSSEPAVVSVMNDKNGDGLPNDIWYELKGSEFSNPESIRNYQITYYKPGSNGIVSWEDNRGSSGELKPNFESNSWWWAGYGDKTSVTFTGTRLPNAYYNNSNNPAVENWVVKSGLFTSGYAECYNNSDYNSTLKANLLDISNAVDQDGNQVQISEIHFIKIQSAVFQIAGWLNEVSTEVSGAADLHLIDKDSY